MKVLDKPLTNVQLELIKIFSFELGESDLIELKKVLSQYFADRATDEMDRLWQENEWSNETMDVWLSGEA